MYIPDGFTESEVLDIIKIIAKAFAHQFTFGSYEPEDIEQEIFIMAASALPKFNSEKSALHTFLTNHIRNRLLNLRRDKYTRPYSPCHKCGLSPCDIATQNECTKYQRWLQRNAAKRCLADATCGESTFSKDNDDNSRDSDSDIEKEVLRNELQRLIDRHLPVVLRADYRRIIDGETIPKRRRTKVFDEIKEILKDYE